jgi:hypothetical protein
MWILDFGQNHNGDQKPVFSRQISDHVDLKQVDSVIAEDFLERIESEVLLHLDHRLSNERR